MTVEAMKQIKSYSPLKWKGFDNQIELTHFVNRNGIADVFKNKGTYLIQWECLPKV